MLRLGTVFLATTLLASLSAAHAADPWTYPVLHIDPPRKVGSDDATLPPESPYTARAAGGARHKLCLLLPQSQDTVFIAYIYGAIAEAQRLGQTLNVFDAGNVENANQQRAQFDNCVTLGVEAIIVESALPGGWGPQVKQARAQGIKVVEATEAMDTPTDGRALIDYQQNGRMLAEVIAKAHPAGGKPVRVLILPGMAGAKFVEDTVKGAKAGLAGSSAVVDNVMYGGLDPASQLKIVEDALVADPDVDYIIGNAMAVTQGVKALKRRNLDKTVKLLSTWLDPDVGAGLKSGDILAASAESSTVLTRTAINIALDAIEGKPAQDIIPVVRLVTKDNVGDKAIMDANYAPEGWQPVFEVK